MLQILFVRIISLYSFMMTKASSGFCTFSGFSFSSSASITSFIVMEPISCFLISSLVNRLVFLVFLEPLHSYKQKITAIPQIENILYKQKMGLRWVQNTSFPTWWRVAKVLYHKYFCKTVFQINLISKKKILKSFR